MNQNAAREHQMAALDYIGTVRAAEVELQRLEDQPYSRHSDAGRALAAWKRRQGLALKLAEIHATLAVAAASAPAEDAVVTLDGVRR